MIFSASASASANACVSISQLRARNGNLVWGSQRRSEPEARQVVERQHGLVGAYIPGVRYPPPAAPAELVPVLVEGRALDHDAVLGRDHGVLERPRATG